MKANNAVKFLFLSLMLVVLLASAVRPAAISAQAPEPLPGTDVGGGNPVPNGAIQPLSAPLAPDAPCGGGSCEPPQGAWNAVSSLPIALYGSAVVSDGVFIYSAGGYQTPGGLTTNQFFRYDPVGNAWTSLAPLPTAVDEALGIYALGKVYILGGKLASGTVTNLVQVYTISDGTWSTVNAMPGNRQQAAGGYYNGKLFVAGGFQTGDTSSAQKQTWAYAINTNIWGTALPDMPAALGGAGSEVINSHLYVVGGRNSAGNTLPTNYEFNLDTLTWATKANMLTATNAPGSVVYRQRLWVFGGGAPMLASAGPFPQSVSAIAKTQIYNPTTDQWVYGPDQTAARSFQGGAVVRNRIVSMGGFNGVDPSTVVEVAMQDPLKILILYSDPALAPPLSLQKLLLLEAGVGQVDLFRATVATAMTSQLSLYDLVVAFSDLGWADAAAQGTALADYLDLGGVVVALPYDWYSTYPLAGRWATGGYSPFASTSQTAWSLANLGTYTIGHPLMAGVTALTAFYRLHSTLAPGATQVAAWSDNEPLAAIKNNVVGVNAYLGDNYLPRQWSNNFADLIVNAGYLLRKPYNACVNLTCSKTIIINGTITDSDASMTSRLTRVDQTSTCANSKTCPAIYGTAGTYHYDTHLFFNNTPSTQCVVVTADASGCGSPYPIQVSVYSQFTATALCTNYLADLGNSPPASTNFSFNVPAYSNYTVVVNQVSTGDFCTAYTLSVQSVSCPEGPLKFGFIPAVRK